jgi:plasmid stabilization system protein ParE
MAQLSPAAQAVLDAVHDVIPDTSLAEVRAIAAALRAAADQLGESPAPGAEFEYLYPRIIEVPDLLAIADELEAQ